MLILSTVYSLIEKNWVDNFVLIERVSGTKLQWMQRQLAINMWLCHTPHIVILGINVYQYVKPCFVREMWLSAGMLHSQTKFKDMYSLATKCSEQTRESEHEQKEQTNILCIWCVYCVFCIPLIPICSHRSFKIRCNFKNISGNLRCNFKKFLEKFYENWKKIAGNF